VKDKKMSVAVVGGGVIGLSVANELVDRGTRVTLFSPQPIGQITSSVAAAFWAPYWVGDYDRQLAIQTLERLQQLASEGTEGITFVDFEEWMTSDFVESYEENIESTHWWRNLPGINLRIEPMPERRSVRLNGEEIDFPERLRFRSVVARMPDYLAWLERRATESGNMDLQRCWIDSLDELCTQFDQVIHCTGWGAKTLASNDPSTANMKLLAGHVVLLDCPGIENATLFHGKPFDANPIYVVPRQGSVRDVLCGGTAIEVQDLPDVRQPITFRKESVCDDVIQRAKSVIPSLTEGIEVGRGVGFRPVRDSVRIERDPIQQNLIHCYGHGGSGLTLSWGSASRVVSLMRAN